MKRHRDLTICVFGKDSIPLKKDSLEITFECLFSFTQIKELNKPKELSRKKVIFSYLQISKSHTFMLKRIKYSVYFLSLNIRYSIKCRRYDLDKNG